MSSPSFLLPHSIFHRSSNYFISKSSTPFKSFGSRLCHRDVLRMSTAASPIKSPAYIQNSPPWLMLPPAFEGDDMFHNFYSLTDKKSITVTGSREKELTDVLSKPNLHCVFKGSSHGYLALFNEVNFDLFLYNPISHRHIKLPPIHNLPNFPKHTHTGLTKVVLSCSPDEDYENCRAVMTYSYPYFMAFCCPGRSNEWRTPFGPYDECVYSSGQQLLFGLTNDDYLETWDLRELSSPRVITVSKKLDFNYYLESNDDKEKHKRLFMPVDHLVVADNNLLLVKRYVMEHVTPDGSYVDCTDDRADNLPHMTVHFCAHKYDTEKGDFVYMDSLDGLALFVGEQSDNVALPAANFPGLKPDSIYFTDTVGTFFWTTSHPDNSEYDAPYGGHDIGIFNYEDETISSCYYPCDVQSIQRILPTPMWFFPCSSI